MVVAGKKKLSSWKNNYWLVGLLEIIDVANKLALLFSRSFLEETLQIWYWHSEMMLKLQSSAALHTNSLHKESRAKQRQIFGKVFFKVLRKAILLWRRKTHLSCRNFCYNRKFIVMDRTSLLWDIGKSIRSSYKNLSTNSKTNSKSPLKNLKLQLNLKKVEKHLKLKIYSISNTLRISTCFQVKFCS